MFSSDSNIETIARLAEELKKYVSLKGEYVKLDITEKAVRLLTAVIMTFVLAVLSLFILGYVSLMVAFAIEPITGKVGAFAIIAAVHAVLFILCILFRKKWIEAPLVRFFTSLLSE